MRTWPRSRLLTVMQKCLLGDTLCPNDCSEHGQCDHHGRCICQFGWYNLDCSQNVPGAVKAWTPRYFLVFDDSVRQTESLLVFRCDVLAVLFGIVAGLAFLQLCVIVFLQKRKSSALRKSMMASIGLAALIRCLYLAIDPFSFRGIFPPYLESILYQSVIALIGAMINRSTAGSFNALYRNCSNRL